METAPDKQHAHELIEQLQASQISTAVRFLEFMLLDTVACAVATAPPDDEPVIREDRRRFHGGSSAPAGRHAVMPPTASSGWMRQGRRACLGPPHRHAPVRRNTALMGDYRVLFTLEQNVMRIFGVCHRAEAYHCAAWRLLTAPDHR